MLLLVLADGDEVGAVEQDVGRHQHRVGEEGVGCLLAVGELVLVGVGQLEARHGGDDGEQPGELLHLRDVALAEEDDLFRVEPGGEEVQRHALGRVAQGLRVGDGGEGVVVGDEVVAVVGLLLKLDALLHGAEIVAEVKAAGRLDAGEYAHGKGKLGG